MEQSKIIDTLETYHAFPRARREVPDAQEFIIKAIEDLQEA